MTSGTSTAMEKRVVERAVRSGAQCFCRTPEYSSNPARADRPLILDCLIMAVHCRRIVGRSPPDCPNPGWCIRFSQSPITDPGNRWIPAGQDVRISPARTCSMHLAISRHRKDRTGSSMSATGGSREVRRQCRGGRRRPRPGDDKVDMDGEVFFPQDVIVVTASLFCRNRAPIVTAVNTPGERLVEPHPGQN